MIKMESTGEAYRCNNCEYIWTHEDDACPNCGSFSYDILMGEFDNIQILQNDIKRWSDREFGMYRNGIPIIYHLKAEVDELIEALKDNHKGLYANTDKTALKRLRESKDKILMEFADCFMLLIDAAAHEQITIDMLTKATKQKLEINKARKWGAANEFGYHEHLKE